MTYPSNILEKMASAAFAEFERQAEKSLGYVSSCRITPSECTLDLTTDLLPVMAAALKAIGLEWRPIEEAPKDGREILMLAGTSSYVVRWLTADMVACGNDGWFVDDNKHGPYALRGYAPTHYLDLAPLLALKGGE